MIGKTDAVGGSLHTSGLHRCRWWISAHQQISTPSSSSTPVTPPPSSEIRCRRIWLSVAGVKTERRSGGRARGAAAQAHRDGVHVELVAGMSFFRSPAPSMPSPRPGLRRGGEAAEMAVGKPARRCGGPRRPLREVRPPLSPAATTQDPAPHGLLPAGSHGILLPAGFADMARGETTMRAAGVGIVESVGARDPSCSSTGEDEPYNGPPAVSSAWENGTEASPHEATRRPSAGQSGG